MNTAERFPPTLLDLERTMPELATAFRHLQNVLTEEDLHFLKEACKRRLSQEGMPCYTLIDELESPTYLKIKSVLEQQLQDTLYYLNDFYIYTDKSSQAGWHMDTELFTFGSAINAWILLSPQRVQDPLGFIHQLNDAPERSYHSVRIKGDDCTFCEFFKGTVTVRSLALIEKEQTHTPEIRAGDLLVINPRRFHRTNVQAPKHSFAIKFLFKGKRGFLADTQVPDFLWPEVATFNELVKQTDRWEEVIERLRGSLATPASRKQLVSGFYPEKFELYKKMVAAL